jgi:hypothetical protein
MPLKDIHQDFETELLEPVRVFEEIATTKTFVAASDFTIEDLCLLEGVLSRVWQTWCRFCRRIIIDSCQGTQDASGSIIPALAGAHSEDLVSGAAIQAKRGQTITWTKANPVLRYEPTWGDVDVLLDIVNALGPGNATKLNAMCAMAGSGARPIQVARNAAAHDNHQTMNDLRKLGTAYAIFSIDHACQSLFWIEPTTLNYLFPFALEQLGAAARYAIQ